VGVSISDSFVALVCGLSVVFVIRIVRLAVFGVGTIRRVVSGLAAERLQAREAEFEQVTHREIQVVAHAVERAAGVRA
jgi:hypothetical protein